jgi:hypothetical protein
MVLPDEFRRCLMRCCYFVNNQPTTEKDYELAVQRNQPSLDVPGPVETLIPCRKAGGQLEESVEASVGFYLGSGLRRAYGTLLSDDKNPSVFDKVTGNFLREATKGDLRKWREAWSEAVKKARK